MKICIIANGYPSQKEPQRGCFELDQARALRKEGHEISILYVDGAARMYWRKIGMTKMLKEGIHVFGLFIFPLSPLKKILPFSLYMRLRSYLFLRTFETYIEENGLPDIIYAHYMYNIASVVTIREKYNIPIVGIEHWSVLNQPTLSDDNYYMGKIAYNGIDKLLAVSNSLAKSIRGKFAKESIVVNDMVGEEFANAEMIDNTRQNKFRFLAIGSLIPRKGFDLLLEAFEKAKLQEKDCELIIIGGGEEKENLQKQIDSLLLSNHVKLVGRKIKEEIISCLRESNVFVLSSHVETFSVVCIEALSIGVPVIATACGGPEEFIQRTDGLLVKPGSVDELGSAMLQMYQNYHNYDRLAISEDCKRRFSPSVIAKQLTDIFQEVLDNRQ